MSRGRGVVFNLKSFRSLYVLVWALYYLFEYFLFKLFGSFLDILSQEDADRCSFSCPKLWSKSVNGFWNTGILKF